MQFKQESLDFPLHFSLHFEGRFFNELDPLEHLALYTLIAAFDSFSQVRQPGTVSIGPGLDRESISIWLSGSEFRPPRVQARVNKLHRNQAKPLFLLPPPLQIGADNFVSISEYCGFDRARFPHDPLGWEATIIHGRPNGFDEKMPVHWKLFLVMDTSESRTKCYQMGNSQIGRRRFLNSTTNGASAHTFWPARASSRHAFPLAGLCATATSNFPFRCRACSCVPGFPDQEHLAKE